MKVAIIHYRLLLKGGLERRLFSYMEWFRKRNDEVTIFVSKISPGMESSIPGGVKLVQLKTNFFPKVFRQWFFNRKLTQRMKKEKFDFSLSLGRTSCQDAVLCPGNHLGFLRAIGKTRMKLHDRMQNALDKKAYEGSRFILAASEMMRKELIELYHVNKEKIHVLYPPADTTRFHSGLKSRKIEWRKKWGMSEGKTTFIFLSASHFRKGLPLLLDVFKKLENEPVELLVAGDSGNPGISNVKFIGFVKEAEELYAAADFTIHPSVYEPYGQIVAESILCGTPVLISNQTAACEIVSSKEGWVLDHLDTEKWADAVMKIRDAQFDISPRFGAEKEITLEDHMKKMLRVCEAT